MSPFDAAEHYRANPYAYGRVTGRIDWRSITEFEYLDACGIRARREGTNAAGESCAQTVGHSSREGAVLAGGVLRSARTPRLFEAGSRDCASDSRRPDVEERPQDDGVLASARFSQQYESPDTLND